MKKLYSPPLLTLKTAGFLLVFLFCLGIQPGKAQYSVIWDFDDTGSNGNLPFASLTLSGNTLYGMTEAGGRNAAGNIFSVDTNGINYKDLHDFSNTSPSGHSPEGSLTISPSGNALFGMTRNGGANGVGIIFSMHTDGTSYKDLYDFNFTVGIGNTPLYGSLLLIGSKLYGMTENGGAAANGCIFYIDTNGTGYTDIYDFQGFDGKAPKGSLTLSGTQLFGMTYSGGANNDGVVFSCDLTGLHYKILFNFNGTNGASPEGDVTISGRTLYGMTQLGGANNLGCVFSLDSTGTGYNDLWDWSNVGANGAKPMAQDLLVEGNTLYGLTDDGGPSSRVGVLFSLNSSGGGFTPLISFDGVAGGGGPYGSLTPSGNKLFGTTSSGGLPGGYGVIFCYTAVGLGLDDLTSTNGAINIYPNPNTGKFTVAIRSQQNEKSIMEVYNILGEQVLTALLNNTNSNNSLDMSSQANGVYLYKVITENGGLIGQGKLIIQK